MRDPARDRAMREALARRAERPAIRRDVGLAWAVMAIAALALDGLLVCRLCGVTL